MHKGGSGGRLNLTQLKRADLEPPSPLPSLLTDPLAPAAADSHSCCPQDLRAREVHGCMRRAVPLVSRAGRDRALTLPLTPHHFRRQVTLAITAPTTGRVRLLL
ncbi:hypothetical protein Q8A67_019472 [Cirrhinus molitorella]|uniref:Uncharacterized protein n=1 Tax=Cirrhinus molitorella TaxID=172907 RepID=A0AA88TGE8_9TELE|nr:hypothetical protein Q8A67_019472 [Cirrhinus molitorella]